jgi:predicted acylesterase/phospholipase RssA
MVEMEPNKLVCSAVTTRIIPQALDVPVWRCARATSAAPTYFSRVEIDGLYYRDGAISGANNPVDHAYREIKRMHPGHEPLVIISVGTGEKDRKDIDSTGGAATDTRDLWALRKHFKQGVQNSENIHENFESANDERHDAAHYFRFNIPTALENGHANRSNSSSIKLGEWKGLRGAETIHNMTEDVQSWLRLERNRIQLENCAQLLVDTRRRRQITERWERFAINPLWYECPFNDNGRSKTPRCSVKARYGSRKELRQHAFDVHGCVERVECRLQMAGVDPATEPMIAGWTCMHDHCAVEVKAFQTEEQFQTHLRNLHDIQDILIWDAGRFEEFLNQGRRTAQST